MAPDWVEYRTGDLIDQGVLAIGDGYRAKNSELAATGIPFARAGNIESGFHFEDADHFPETDLSKVGEKISCPGDVVFTSKGTVGRFAFVRDNTPRFVYSPQLCYWRSLDDNVIDARFLFYWMQSREFRLQADGVKGQTDMADYVSLGDQRRMRLTLPNIDEQRAIARILGALDDKIELNRRMNQTLEEMARAIFKSWFVDFDPVVSKAEGRQPYGMNAETAMLFPSAFQDSELGSIPKGWQVGRISDLLQQSRMGLDPSEFPDEVFSHYSIPAFDNGGVPLQEFGASIKSNKYLIPASVVLLSKLNPETPRVWWPASGNQLRPICSTEFIVAMPVNGVPAEFLYSLFKSSDFSAEFATLVTGTSGSHQRVKPEDFMRMRVVVPSTKVITAYQRVTAPLFRRARFARSESVTLAAIRDALLPKLLSGEMRVKDATDFQRISG